MQGLFSSRLGHSHMCSWSNKDKTHQDIRGGDIVFTSQTHVFSLAQSNHQPDCFSCDGVNHLELSKTAMMCCSLGVSWLATCSVWVLVYPMGVYEAAVFWSEWTWRTRGDP